MVKNFHLSRLQTHYILLYLFVVRNSHVFNFCRTGLLMKIFHTEFFPNFHRAIHQFINGINEYGLLLSTLI